MKGRLGRLLGRRARWAGPGRAATIAVAAALVAVLAGAALLHRWATGTEPPARTLALAASVLPAAPALDSALAVTWTWSVGGARALDDRWLGLVAPSAPPGICPASGTDPEPPARDGEALAPAVRRLDAAVRRGVPAEELERRILELRAVDGGPRGGRRDFLVRYNLARGYLAAGDPSTAAAVLEPVLEARAGPQRLPETGPEAARRAVASDRVERGDVLDGFHARYLAGAAAHRRGRPGEAVHHFRRAINAVYYLLALEGDLEAGGQGHQRRVAADLGAEACPGEREPLTSLDAYAGLVASYMADEDFSDPGSLAREVVRGPFDMDRGDPLAPVLRLARRRGGGGPVPEHLLWAASNLQRVYHHNRLRPDPRLEVTRAVLLLHLTGEPRWREALEDQGGGDPCAMWGALADDLQRASAAAETRGGRPARADSARAAVAVQAFARLERSCDGRSAPPLDAAVRSAWIRLGGGWLTRGLGTTYEELRVALVHALGATRASPAVLEERVAPVLERAASHRRALHAGRVPAEMPADLAVEPARRFVDEWWGAVFTEVADSVASAAREGTVRAGRRDDLLAALESATGHAGLRPAEVWDPGEIAALVEAAGPAPALVHRVRYRARSHPLLWGAGLAALAGLAAFLVLVVHVGAWRYRLSVGTRFWAAERAARARRAT